MKVIVAGCRSFNNYELLKTKLDEILEPHLIMEKLNPKHLIIVSGAANGADKLGEQYAIERKLKIDRYPADWQKFHRRAGPIRNAQMAEVGEMLVAFWDGESSGTKHMIKIAKNKGLIVHIIKIDSAYKCIF